MTTTTTMMATKRWRRTQSPLWLTKMHPTKSNRRRKKNTQVAAVAVRRATVAEIVAANAGTVAETVAANAETVAANTETEIETETKTKTEAVAIETTAIDDGNAAEVEAEIATVDLSFLLCTETIH